MSSALQQPDTFLPRPWTRGVTLARPSFLRGGAWDSPAIVRAWNEMLERSPSPHREYQSRAWLDHRVRAEPSAPVVLAMLDDGDGVPVALAPVLVETRELEFAVSDLHLASPPIRCAVTLGGTPLARGDDPREDELLCAIADELEDCDAIEMDLVAKSSAAYQRIIHSPEVRERFLVYEPHVQGAGPVQRIEMPASFEAYLAKFSGKTRATLRRRVKAMRARGDLVLARFDAPGSGQAFLDAAASVAQHTWQRHAGDRFESGTTWPARIVDLAAHGMLRGYVLYSAGEPCAFVFGVELDGTFHYVKPGFDERLAKLAPGTVLLYMMLEDMFAHGPPRTVCFCTGDAPYKRFFANAEVDVTDVLLLRRRVQNYLLRAVHAGFRGSVVAVKRWLNHGS